MLIDYDNLVKHYQEEIQVKLRNFRPAHEFLEMWVHDEDDARSLLNIAESAEIGGIDFLQIKISNNTAKNIDLKNLTDLISKMGQISCKKNKDHTLLEIAYV